MSTFATFHLCKQATADVSCTISCTVKSVMQIGNGRGAGGTRLAQTLSNHFSCLCHSHLSLSRTSANSRCPCCLQLWEPLGGLLEGRLGLGFTNEVSDPLRFNDASSLHSLRLIHTLWWHMKSRGWPHWHKPSFVLIETPILFIALLSRKVLSNRLPMYFLYVGL